MAIAILQTLIIITNYVNGTIYIFFCSYYHSILSFHRRDVHSVNKDYSCV